MCAGHPQRSTVEKNGCGNLVQSSDFFFGSLRVVHIEQSRNVVHVLSALPLNDSLLTATDGREVTLLLSEEDKEYKKQLPRDSSVL